MALATTHHEHPTSPHNRALVALLVLYILALATLPAFAEVASKLDEALAPEVEDAQNFLTGNTVTIAFAIVVGIWFILGMIPMARLVPFISGVIAVIAFLVYFVIFEVLIDAGGGKARLEPVPAIFAESKPILAELDTGRPLARAV